MCGTTRACAGTSVGRRTALAATLLSIGLLVVGSARGEGGHSGYPSSIVVLGHSGATGYNSDPLRPVTDVKANSWATGTNPSVNSIYLRLLAENAAIGGRSFNLAEDGARAADLADQAELAVRVKPSPDLILVQIIGNDISCDGRDAGRYPPFRATMVASLRTLSKGVPNARIFVVSDTGSVRGYATAVRDIPEARAGSTGAGPCDLFTPAGAIDQAHVANLQGIIDGYERQLVAACARFVHCRYDGGGAGTFVEEADDFTSDYGHLAVHGQRKLAAAVWPALFDFTDRSPPTSRAMSTRSSKGKRVALAASDNARVSGIEYKLASPAQHSLGRLPFTRYGGPVLVRRGWTLIWRAVDVNGNSEATHSLRG